MTTTAITTNWAWITTSGPVWERSVAPTFGEAKQGLIDHILVLADLHNSDELAGIAEDVNLWSETDRTDRLMVISEDERVFSLESTDDPVDTDEDVV